MLLCLNDSTTDEPLPPAKDKYLMLADLKLGFIGGGRSSSSVCNVFISLAFTDQRGLQCIFASRRQDREEGLRAEGVEKKELRRRS